MLALAAVALADAARGGGGGVSVTRRHVLHRAAAAVHLQDLEQRHALRGNRRRRRRATRSTSGIDGRGRRSSSRELPRGQREQLHLACAGVAAV